MMIRNVYSLIIALNLFLAGSSHAAVIANLTYIEPTGNVSPTDSIEVWVRLSLDPLSEPFTYDNNIVPTAGLPTSLVPTEGYVYDPETFTSKNIAFAEYTGVGIGVGYDYQFNNFINECNSSTCGYDYHGRRNLPGSTRELEKTSFIINPGESIDIFHGIFTPRQSEGATPKDYTLYNVTLTLGFYGLSSEGENITGYTILAETCPTRDSSCSFTRTVSAVPIPATMWLFVSGLIALLGLSKRRCCQKYSVHPS